MNLEPRALSGAILDENTLVEVPEPAPLVDPAKLAGLGRGKSNDLAMVIGSGTTQIFTPRRGLVFHEGSVVTLRSGRAGDVVHATGNEAQRMVGRVPGHLQTVRPVQHDLVAEPKVAESMVRSFLERSESLNGIVPPRVVLAVPSGLTPVQKRGFREACMGAGIRQVHLVSRAVAAAIGASPPPHATMLGIVDFGEGTTDVGIIGPSSTLALDSVRVGLISLDDTLRTYLTRRHNLIIGEATAANIRVAVGSAVVRDRDVNRYMSVTGRDLMQGVPREIQFSTREYADAIAVDLARLTDFVTKMIERADARFELYHTGLILTGMGADLPNLGHELSLSTGLPVTMSPAPAEAAVRGASVVLGRPQLLKMLSRQGGDIGLGLFDLRDDRQVVGN